MKRKGYKKEEYAGKLDNDLVCPECKNPISSEIFLSRLDDFDIMRCGFCSRAYKVSYIITSVELED
jgi:hypothetical protein